jgi:hypothetical protein
MSGTSLMLQPLPPFLPEIVYSAVIKSLDAGELSIQERIKMLLDLPNDKLAILVPPGLPLLPVVDNDLIPGNLNFAQVSSKETPSVSLPGRTWCEEVLVGDCQFDVSFLISHLYSDAEYRQQASIFKFMLGPRVTNVSKTFCESVNKTLGDNGKKVLQAYDITSDLSDDEGLYRILKFCTDISFFAPAIALAKGWPGNAHVYHFNEPNPWDGAWKGEAGHVLDVAYLFQNYNDFLDEAQRQVAVQFAGDFIKFMNGKVGWPAFGAKEGAQVYGPSGKGFTSDYVEGVAASASGRKNTVYELAKDIGLDNLAGAWGAFLTGK